MKLRRADRIPFILDDLPEAVQHAIVGVFTGALAGLQLSVQQLRLGSRDGHVCIHSSLHDVQRVPAELLVLCIKCMII